MILEEIDMLSSSRRTKALRRIQASVKAHNLADLTSAVGATLTDEHWTQIERAVAEQLGASPAEY